MCFTVENAPTRQIITDRFTNELCTGTLVILANDDGMDRYFIREGGRSTPVNRPTVDSLYCWAPTLGLAGVPITSQACNVDSDLFLWEIEEVG